MINISWSKYYLSFLHYNCYSKQFFKTVVNESNDAEDAVGTM